MKTNQVIIMDVEKRYTTAYTTDGQFIKIPRKDWHKVGAMLALEDLKDTPWGNAIGFKIAATTAIALLIVFFGIFNPFLPQAIEAETYLSLGLTSGGIEIWTDHDNKVVELSYRHDDTFLELDKMKGKDIYEVITALTSDALALNLLIDNPDDLFLIDIVNLTEKANDHIQEREIRKCITDGLNGQDYKGIMIMSHHNREYLEKAHELDLTASEYNIYEKSNASGYTVSEDHLKHGHIRNVLNEAGTTPEELFKIDHHNNTNHHSNRTNNTAPIDNTNSFEHKMKNKGDNKIQHNDIEYEINDSPNHHDSMKKKKMQH